MKNKLAILALGAVLSTGLIATSASAVTVLPNSTSVLNNVASAPDGYYEATVKTPSITGPATASALFHFVAVAGFSSVDVDVSASGSNFGTTFGTWKDITANTAAVTLNNVLTNTYTLIVGHTYDLFFQVSHSASPKAGAVISSFTVTPSAVPVPPAAILLLSGLVGIGALGRKRSGKVSV
jgi:hypothetical protein